MTNQKYIRNLAPSAAGWVQDQIADDLDRRDAKIERLQEALRKCLDLMHNGGTWGIEEQKYIAALAGEGDQT